MLIISWNLYSYSKFEVLIILIQFIPWTECGGNIKGQKNTNCLYKFWTLKKKNRNSIQKKSQHDTGIQKNTFLAFCLLTGWPRLTVSKKFLSRFLCFVDMFEIKFNCSFWLFFFFNIKYMWFYSFFPLKMNTLFTQTWILQTNQMYAFGLTKLK